MRESAAQLAQAEGLAGNHRVQGNAHHQRRFARLFEPLVEMVGDHVGELGGADVAAEAAAYDEAIARYDAKAAGEAQKKADLKAQAEQDQKTYDSLNYRDDQFDLSDAALAITIALLAVAALTKIWWMYWLSWLPISFGVLMGLSGLLGWALHPDTLARLPS